MCMYLFELCQFIMQSTLVSVVLGCALGGRMYGMKEVHCTDAAPSRVVGQMGCLSPPSFTRSVALGGDHDLDCHLSRAWP